ncbi:MAG: hypothetical protein IJA68_01690 [Clostridia bacterium]|nr:hypothetical protein [Clostridia bacterium]
MNTAPDVLHLQQQAAARVREMEERTRRLVQEHPVNVYHGVTVAPFLDRCEREKPTPPPCEAPTLPHLPTDSDRERYLLLLLAAMLSQNNAPIELLLALLYIAL